MKQFLKVKRDALQSRFRIELPLQNHLIPKCSLTFIVMRGFGARYNVIAVQGVVSIEVNNSRRTHAVSSLCK
jgi:hypothetical protein